ncbi:MAG: glutamate-1-semialdehyde 2,1-aminomutase [Thermoprotei archaeon]
MEKSRELYERAKLLIPGGVNSPVRAFQPYPFFVSRARGSRLFDVDNNEYIDYVMGYGALLYGHKPDFIIEKVKNALENGTLYGAPTENEIILAEKIRELYPSIEMVRLANSGTEATMHAIRLARGYTNRRKIIKFAGCFHGSHDAVLVKAGSGALTFGIPSSLGVLEDTAKHTLVSRFNDIELTEKLAKEYKNDLAAIILEPVMANVGLILPHIEFLKAVREIADNSGAVLIFDEIVTGFRLAPGGAQEYYGIKPDLTTLGKILGGGFPVSAFGGKSEIMKNLAPQGKVYQAGTYSGNTVSTTAALASIEYIINNRHIYQTLRQSTQKIIKPIRELIQDKKLPITINTLESMFQIFFINKPVNTYDDALTSNTELFMKYHTKLLKQGIFIPPSQFETCFLSTAHTVQDIEKTTNIIIQTIGEIFKSATPG